MGGQVDMCILSTKLCSIARCNGILFRHIHTHVHGTHTPKWNIYKMRTKIAMDVIKCRFFLLFSTLFYFRLFSTLCAMYEQYILYIASVCPCLYSCLLVLAHSAARQFFFVLYFLVLFTFAIPVCKNKM